MFGLFLFFPLHHQAARSWNAVRHARLFCQAVQPGVVYVAPSAPCAHATTLFDSSAANVGRGACGVRLGVRGLMRVISVFYLPCEKIACDSRGEDGAVQHVSSHGSQQRGRTPVHPVELCELDTCPDIMSSPICQYEGQLSLCGKLVIFI